MAKYKSQFDLPYDANSNTRYFWSAFVKQTNLGNPKAAVIAYHEFSKEREALFQRQKSNNDFTL